MIEYQLPRPIGRCSITDRVIEPGEDFYTAVFDTDGQLERRDYALDAWQGPPESALCHFKTRIARKDDPARTFVDDDSLVASFLRLVETDDVRKLRFRFVLSLILLRKRLLKYERSIRENGVECWEMRLMRDRSLHRILNPVLAEDEIEDLTRQLTAILHADALARVATEGPADAQPDDSAKPDEGDSNE